MVQIVENKTETVGTSETVCFTYPVQWAYYEEKDCHDGELCKYKTISEIQRSTIELLKQRLDSMFKAKFLDGFFYFLAGRSTEKEENKNKSK